jgi:hypothetical protein
MWKRKLSCVSAPLNQTRANATESTSPTCQPRGVERAGTLPLHIKRPGGCHVDLLGLLREWLIATVMLTFGTCQCVGVQSMERGLPADRCAPISCHRSGRWRDKCSDGKPKQKWQVRLPPHWVGIAVSEALLELRCLGLALYGVWQTASDFRSGGTTAQSEIEPDSRDAGRGRCDATTGNRLQRMARRWMADALRHPRNLSDVGIAR